MSQVHENLPNKSFDEPSDLVNVSYCLDSGMLATSACRSDVRGSRVATGTYVNGDQPTEECTVHTYVKVCSNSSGIYKSGSYCPSSTVRTVSLPRYERVLVQSGIRVRDAQYSYNSIMAKGQCPVHTSGYVEPSDPSEEPSGSPIVSESPEVTPSSSLPVESPVQSSSPPTEVIPSTPPSASPSVNEAA